MTQVMQFVQQQVMPDKQKKQRRLSVAQIVPIGFGSVLAIVGIATTVTEISKANLKETQGLVSHTFEVQTLLREVEKDLVDAETGQRGFLVTNAPNYLEPYDSGRKNFQDHIEKLKKLVSDNPTQVTRAEAIQQTAQQKFAELEETINLKKAGKDKEAVTLVLSNKGKQIMDDMRAKLATMDQEEVRLLGERQQASNQVQLVASVV
ncbi:MAG: CHASE3 domain-containing protein, partial [Coleofasciculus sp. Co-bin14]|nr:CHASE3 domain-containing protein [Coleofasciculus sp. Co-bin14]